MFVTVCSNRSCIEGDNVGAGPAMVTIEMTWGCWAPDLSPAMRRENLKTALIAILLAAAAGSSSASTQTSGLVHLGAWSPGTSASTPIIQTANRTGSHRVGGSGRSGKGGHYVGGHRK